MKIIEFLSALLAPITAIFAIWIANKQCKIDSKKLRFDLYEKRYGIFIALKNLLSNVLEKADIDKRTIK